MSRRTVADLNRSEASMRWNIRWQSPEDAGVLLFVTSVEGCLTHIVRFVGDQPENIVKRTTLPPIVHPANRVFEALCGVHGSTNRGVILVDPADELFGCHACIARAEKYGLPTFNLLPSTGCQATEGARYRPRSKVPA